MVIRTNAWLFCLLFLSTVLPVASSFVTPQWKRPSLQCQMLEKRLEDAAVRRFTVGYDKLCKNCPTRLEPRVDTLTEMIMGLTVDDRDEVLAAVVQRIEESKKGLAMGTGLRTSTEVYTYQCAGADDKSKLRDATNRSEQEGSKKRKRKQDTHDSQNDDDAYNQNMRLVRIMRKKKSKACARYTKSEVELATAGRLYEVATMFLAGETDGRLDNSVKVTKEIAKMRNMSRSDLKTRRFEHLALVTKFEKRKAKYSAKRYEANLELSRIEAAIEQHKCTAAIS